MDFHNFIITWLDGTKPKRMFSIPETDWDKARDQALDAAWEIDDVATVEYWGTSQDDLSGDLPKDNSGLRDCDEVLSAFVSDVGRTHH